MFPVIFFFIIVIYQDLDFRVLASKKCGKKASTPADAQIWLTKMSQMSNVSGNFWWFIVEFHKKANKNISNGFFKINAKWQKCYFLLTIKTKTNTDFILNVLSFSDDTLIITEKIDLLDIF